MNDGGVARTFFTSDHHFGHKRIIELCGRPFRDLDEMHRVMIDRWNAVVRPEDTVVYLGDFGFGPRVQLRAWREQLNGAVYLVLGNHDRSATAMTDAGFQVAGAQVVYPTPAFDVLLAHRPDLDQNQAMERSRGVTSRQKYMLCGHVHESWRRIGNVINVGVDQWDFTPRTPDELLAATP